ncbi:MAG: hypothetical protein AAGD43_03030 [Pseudomonadota bacterium]
MAHPPRWTTALVAVWSLLLIGLGFICVLAPQLILAEEGHRTMMRGVASMFGMLVIALGVQAIFAARSARIGQLQTVLGVVCLWALLLPTTMMTNWGAFEPFRMRTGLNVFLLAGLAQFALGIPALVGFLVLRRISREATR